MGSYVAFSGHNHSGTRVSATKGPRALLQLRKDSKTDLNRAFLRVHWLGYIDLSKRRVSATDIVKCEERYNKSKAVHSIMSTVAKKENKDLEILYEQLAWPLYAKYGHAYDAFKAALKYVLFIVCASEDIQDIHVLLMMTQGSLTADTDIHKPLLPPP